MDSCLNQGAPGNAWGAWRGAAASCVPVAGTTAGETESAAGTGVARPSEGDTGDGPAAAPASAPASWALVLRVRRRAVELEPAAVTALLPAPRPALPWAFKDAMCCKMLSPESCTTTRPAAGTTAMGTHATCTWVGCPLLTVHAQAPPVSRAPPPRLHAHGPAVRWTGWRQPQRAGTAAGRCTTKTAQ
jgi:hypothetical protein